MLEFFGKSYYIIKFYLSYRKAKLSAIKFLWFFLFKERTGFGQEPEVLKKFFAPLSFKKAAGVLGQSPEREVIP